MYPFHKSSHNLRNLYHRTYLQGSKMPLVVNLIFLLIGCLFLDSCDSVPPLQTTKGDRLTRHGEYISRLHDDQFAILPLKNKEIPSYPWKKKLVGGYPQITKEYFRCKGSYSNPDKFIEKDGKISYVPDCGGIDEHSLPLRNQKEFIYPILINLLNYVQGKLNRQVIITTGHSCPVHNLYNDPLPSYQYSKHMIGAEVSFYVKGLERHPDRVIALLQAYFKENDEYNSQREFQEFHRWEKKTDVSTPPWFNKEIFIKLYKPSEGRNFDNQHPFSYIAIQVRFDKELNERIEYTWEQAFKNYLRF